MNAKPQRICIVRHSYYPSCTRIYKQARSLTEAGYAVDVVCLRGNDPARETLDGVRVYRVLSAHRRGSVARYIVEYLLSLLVMGATLSVLFIKYRYRCVQVNTLPDSLVFAALLPRICGARILLDLHEPTPELLLTKYEGRVSQRALKLHILLEKLAIGFAHQVITVNETIRNRFIERGADPDKIHVVRNVPPDDFAGTVVAGRPHEGLVVMTHGTIQPRYGQNLLLQALPAVRRAVESSLRVVVAGDGESVEELKELARTLSCDDIVTFTGMVSRDRIAELISEADIGVVPLLPGPFSDLCQPNKLFEYVTMQVPAVVARLPAIEETFDDSCLQYFRAGDLEDLTKALVKLAKDPALRKTRASNALARFELIKWANAKKDYVRIVDSLLALDRQYHALRIEDSHAG